MHVKPPTTWAIIAATTMLISTIGAAGLAAMLGPSGPDDATGADHGRDEALASGSYNGAPLAVETHREKLAELLAPRQFDPFTAPAIEHEPPLPLEPGKIPTKAAAKKMPSAYQNFIAKGDAGIDELRANGYLRGAGTPDDPYILEDFYVADDLKIQSTHRALIIRNGYVDGQLSLNYAGPDIYVHHVHADDLRINENVRRSGTNTGGLFEHNTFGFVGQIRHFIGEFRHNTIGPRPQGLVVDYLSDTGTQRLPGDVVFNFDGFHGAHMHHNLFNGRVDIKLHGHNHGDCFTCPVHDHADKSEYPVEQRQEERAAEATGANDDQRATDADAVQAGQNETADPSATSDDASGTHDHGHDGDHAHADDRAALDSIGYRTRHSLRYHSLMFNDNTIKLEQPAGIALRYNDRNHAGDDRTANSEPNEHLDDPHIHYQDITMRDNKIENGQLIVDIFNAQDERHNMHNRGILRLLDNTISIAADPEIPHIVAMAIQSADGLELLLSGNTIRFPPVDDDDAPATRLKAITRPDPTMIGIRLHNVEAANLTLAKNTVARGELGVQAIGFEADTYWELLGNTFKTKIAYRGQNVENAPYESEDSADTRRR